MHRIGYLQTNLPQTFMQCPARKFGTALKLALAAGLFCFFAATLQAAPSIYFDINGTTAGSGVASAGSYSWENAFWDTTSAGTGAAINFTEGDFARFAAGTDAGTKNYTITASSDHLIGGMFLQANGGGTVTINGPGTLNIDPTGGPVQGFLVNGSSQTLIINATLGGTGGVENESSGSLDLFGNNSYSGGTILGTSAGLNFNNNNSFGTGGITWGVGQQVLANDTATTPITLNNTMSTRAASTLIYVGPAASPLTFNNTWTLAAGTSTLTVGNASHLSTKMTISGALGGVGANLVVNGTGTLVLSGANTYNGTTTVGGTSKLVLGAANTIASSSSLTLFGGTLNPNGLVHTMSSTTLSLNTNSIIDYSAGASEVDFANSSTLIWAGILNLASWDSTNDKLRFGTDSTGLTGSQLAEIEFNGAGLGSAGIDANGYIIQVPEPSAVALTLLGALGFAWNLRRRKS